MSHRLHRAVGEVLREAEVASTGVTLLLDPACGTPGSKCHNLPLFLKPPKNNATEICNVDAVLLAGDRIKVVVEIEETNVGPTQICGKFLTTALAKGLIHEAFSNRLVEFDDSTVFVQVLDTSGLSIERTAKIDQWINIRDAIRKLLPLLGGKLAAYELVYGNASGFGPDGAARKSLKSVLDRALGVVKAAP